MSYEHVLWIFGRVEFMTREGGYLLLAGALAMLAIGGVIGLFFWKQRRVLATMIEADTRRNQSDYDLVSRDIVKIKQEVAARAEQTSNL